MHTPRSPRAFSLLELCLAIAGIAVLVVLMLPAFSSMREGALVTRCVGQLRQVGAAFHLYAIENRNKLPEMVYGRTHPNKGQPIPITYGYAAMPFCTRLLKPPYDISPEAKGTLADANALFCPAAVDPMGIPIRAPRPPALLGSAAAPYIGYNFIYVDTRVGYAANLYKDYDNVRIGASQRNPPLLWCYTPEFFAKAGTAHRTLSNVLRMDGSVHALSHARIDAKGENSPSDIGLRLLQNLTQ